MTRIVPSKRWRNGDPQRGWSRTLEGASAGPRISSSANTPKINAAKYRFCSVLFLFLSFLFGFEKEKRNERFIGKVRYEKISNES